MEALRKALREKIDELDSDKMDWPSRALFQAYQFCQDRTLSDPVIVDVIEVLGQISDVKNSTEQARMAELINIAIRAVAS